MNGEPESPKTAHALHCDELYLPARTIAPDNGTTSAFTHPWVTLSLPDVDVVLVHASAAEAAEWARKHEVHVDLVYIDPPYASHRDYVFRQSHPVDGRPVTRVAFGDRWTGGIAEYVRTLRPVVIAIHDLLSERGSFLLHVDPRGAPYLSILCDEIFGMGERLPQKSAPGFRNELIWKYGLGGSSPYSWPRKHDNILWYTKAKNWYFDPPMTPASSNRMRGQLKKQPDVLDVPTLNNMAKDRTGYPTQKPVELLEMLVRAHAPEGACVADLFAGSGTTAVASVAAGRYALCADVSADAIAVTRARLVEAGARVAVFRRREDVRDSGRPVPNATVFSAEGCLRDDGCFVVAPGQQNTHEIVRDVDGNEAIRPLEAR